MKAFSFLVAFIVIWIFSGLVYEHFNSAKPSITHIELFTDMNEARQYHRRCLKYKGRLLIREMETGLQITCYRPKEGFKK